MSTSSFYKSSGSTPAVENSIQTAVTQAAGSATQAQTSATSANTSATNAQNSLNSFQQYYLGAYSSAPSTTQLGSMYFDTGTSQLYIWSGSSWDVTASANNLQNTDGLTEGSSNLYFTNERVDDRVNNLLTAGSNITLSYNDAANTLTIASTAQASSGSTDFVGLTDTPSAFTGYADQLLRVNNYETGVDFYDITAGDLDMQGNKVLFGNMYSQESNLPSASTYHGMFAHVHSTGKGYFAHGGGWHKLLDETSSTTTDLSEGSNLYFTNERVDDRVSNLLTAGSNITLTYNDSANTLTIASTASGTGGSTTFTGLTDTPSSMGTSGQYLAVNSGGNALEFVAAPSGGSGSSTFSGLTDTPASLGTAGQYLAVNSGATALEFVAAPSGGSGATTLSGLNDVSNATPANGQVLTYDTSTSLWQPITPSGGGSGSATFTGLTDTPSSFTATKFLRANSGGTALEYATALTPSNLTVTNNAASGGGSISYIPGANGATLNFIPPDLSSYATTASLASVATSGAYSDLTGTPSLSSYIALTDLSVTNNAASGSGSLAYNNTTGVFTFTPPASSGGGSAPAWLAASNTTAATASGINSIAIGEGATATALRTLAVGLSADSTDQYAVSLGHFAEALAESSTALGYDTNVSSTHTYSTALGRGATTTASRQLMLGQANTSAGLTSIQVGNTNYTPSNSMDLTTKSYVDTAVAGAGGGIALTDLSANIGVASGSGSLGYNNTTGVFTYTPPDLSSYATASSTTTFTNKSGNISQWTNDSGYLTAITGQSLYSLSNVNTSSSPTDGQVLTWDNTNSYWKPTTVSAGTSFAAADYVKVDPYFANPATVSGSDSISIGRNTQIASDYSVGIGSTGFTTSGADYSVALGYNANSQSAGGVAIGALTGVGTNESYSTALGYNAGATTTNQLMLGANNATYGFTSILVGNASYTPTQSMDLTTKDYVDTAVAGGGGGGITGITFQADTGAATVDTNDFYAMAMGGSAHANGLASVAIGYQARTNGNSAISIGHDAGYDGDDQQGIAIGYSTVTNGQNNYPIAIGYKAECLGGGGIAIGSGYSSGSNHYYARASLNCVAIGMSTYTYGTSVAVGHQAWASGVGSTSLGRSAYCSASNATAIGQQAQSTSANKFVLGNSSVTDLRCQDTSISSVSDRRDKTQIELLAVGLDFVNAVEPKAFYKNNRNEYYVPAYTDEQLSDDPELEQSYTFNQSDYEAATKKFEKREFGFVAQDVAAELPSQYSDARVSFAETDDLQGFDVQRFTMGDMTPILWKALRELSDKHDQLQSDYDALLARVVALENA
jgi:hypothetical protein